MASVTYSGRRVYWPSQETLSDWKPVDTNSAGYYDLATDGVLVCGLPTRGQTLLWTTTDIWTMTFIGGVLVFSFLRASNNCGIIGQRAAIVLDTEAYWMGTRRFFGYAGFVKVLDCPVTDYVFNNFNWAQGAKVFAYANPQFGEVTWHYPSRAAIECDRYVTYNYREQHWTFGQLARVCGVARMPGTSGNPVLIGSDGKIYDHETGTVHGTDTPFLESGPMQLGDGDRTMRVQRIVPDDKTLGDVSLSLYGSMFPDDAETLYGPYTATSPTSVRLVARQLAADPQFTAVSGPFDANGTVLTAAQYAALHVTYGPPRGLASSGAAAASS